MSLALFPTPTVSHERRTLGQLLLDREFATYDQIEEASQLQEASHGHKLLGEILIELGHCTEEEILECIAAEMDLPFARLDNRLCDPNVVDSLPRDFLEKYALLPLFRIRDALTIAVADATDVFLLDRLRDLARCEVQVVIATARDIRKLQQALLAQPGAQQDSETVRVDLADTDRPGSSDRNSAAPAASVVQNLLLTALREGASDIHLEPSDRALRVRFRIDGSLFEHQQLPRSACQSVADCLRAMANLDANDRRPQEGRFRFAADDRTLDVFVHTMPVVQGEKVTLKLVDIESGQFALDRLGFSGEILAQVQRRLALKRGLVLVTGPKGSGKSTTMYAALQMLSQSAVNICTVEDPVECRLLFANQSRVDDAAGLTTAVLLRALIRQDADVLMAHHLSDLETTQLAVQAALGGSLVLSTLETNDAAGGLSRLRDMGLEGYHLAGAVNMILAQRLCRRVCTKCRTTYEPSRTTLQTVERMGVRAVTFHRGTGCTHCRQTGYRGRIAIHELLVVEEDLRELLTSRASQSEIRTHVHTKGMLCLRYDGLAKAREGLTTPEEVLRVTDEGWVPQRRAITT